ncbi:ribonuclease P protein component [Actinomycetospora sp. NBRC 106375]|uniref:ribonuclease P protein component n=1 Tax=Actinomycetospora sp. NBRC 106375 TaxID=3032207 RepID=UPI0025555733|nr:ribonuclease P protein component [Actinomycetospora sp. NBRC 106375]
MLPRELRITRPQDFRRVLRGGRRAGRRHLVVHAVATPATDRPVRPARAGLVVGRGVGPAVTRHRVSRRLRHLLRPRLEALPAGTDLVVRAQPPAADATSAQLGDDLDAALARLRLTD